MNLPNDDSIRYLTALDLYNINHAITGDTYVRDVHLLKSAATRPAISVFGEEQFPTLLDKAAALLESLAYHHLFADGNKRTAVEAVERFLKLNGCAVEWDFDKEYPFILEVAQGLHNTESIAVWLASFVRGLR
jgi:death-on-curing protein